MVVRHSPPIMKYKDVIFEQITKTREQKREKRTQAHTQTQKVKKKIKN